MPPPFLPAFSSPRVLYLFATPIQQNVVALDCHALPLLRKPRRLSILSARGIGGVRPPHDIEALQIWNESGAPSDNVRVIRALLAVRQTECPTGTVECANIPGGLVPQLSFSFGPLVAFRTWSSGSGPLR